MTLYEISSELSEIEDALIESAGEIPEGEAGETFEQWWAHLQDQRDEKLRNICALIANSEAEGDAIEVEIARLRRSLDARRNLARRLKDRIKAFFEAHGIRKLNLGIFKPRIQANGGVAPLLFPENWETHPTQAPREFQRVVIELDKEALRKVVADFYSRAEEITEVAKDDQERRRLFAQWIEADQDAGRTKALIEGCVIGERGTHLRIR